MITKKKIERLTSQKKIIVDYLKSVKTHPSAKEIYFNVRKKLPRISRGTVYRILNNLKEKSEILEIHCGISNYDSDVFPHGHFICEKCERIYDVSDECGKCNIIKSKKTKVGKIKNYKVYFYGLCKNCSKQ